ncbi:telomere repeat-binding factor 1 isoform X1 [Diospyros lotus]|uniref:telomere repeat-binding factor 1 isoform X1 n=1 Tax=Diospyros lotus TaxID=55363 RepID=UPI00225A8130|nr:telomere repeat-binding factor 1 isoform X1 [Diospyros lotus]
MGAPKQKWTPEEEAALKAGVLKHGAGKWRTILKDQEFSGVLYLRSNVDLKDKWRNMSVMANGWGSREKARLALKRMQPLPKQDETPIAPGKVVQSDEEIADAKPLPAFGSAQQTGVPKRSIVREEYLDIHQQHSHPILYFEVEQNLNHRYTIGRLDNLIMEAINNLEEPGGSNKTTIATYIEEQYWAPPNFKRLLSAKLKFLTANGKLIKMKRKYRIGPPPSALVDKRRSPSMLLLDGRPRAPPKVDKDEITVLTKAQIDLELAKMRNMTPEEAAAAAAQAVAEAEAAIAEAEEAAREAEAAEADAEAAQAFAEAAMKTLKGRNPQGMMARA